jgi:hypothetical protein
MPSPSSKGPQHEFHDNNLWKTKMKPGRLRRAKAQIAKGDKPDALLALAGHYAAMGEAEEMVRLLRLLVDQDCTAAILLVAGFHMDCGHQTLAHQHLLHAAKLNSVQAQVKLGVSYATGHGVPVDYALALYWVGQAAKGNKVFKPNQTAQYTMGMYCTMTILGPHSEVQAVRWFMAAARQGCIHATASLDNMLLRMYNNKVLAPCNHVGLVNKGFHGQCTKCRSWQNRLEKKLLLCSKCRVVRYCNRDCQRADFGRHKAECGHLHAAKRVWGDQRRGTIEMTSTGKAKPYRTPVP